MGIGELIALTTAVVSALWGAIVGMAGYVVRLQNARLAERDRIIERQQGIIDGREGTAWKSVATLERATAVIERALGLLERLDPPRRTRS